MVRWLLGIVVFVVLLLSSSVAWAERDLIVPFHEGGHVVLDQLAGLRLDMSGFSYAAPAGVMMRTANVGGVEQSTTSVWFAPAADVFVTDHLSVGGRVDVQHTWGAVESGGQRLELPGTTSMTFLPRVGFYVPFGDRVGLWARAGVGWTRTESASFLAAGSAPTTDTFRAMVLNVDASIVYRFNETFFMKGGPEVGVTFGGRSESSTNGVSTGGSASVLQLGGTLGFGMNIEL
ncbi:MAG: hypothetical protein KIT84_12195 [Labilithrix sp.]|nr:hypothetical protein [Labilithrix sp.]MCW5811773.1 hypothetical protein [Labilithrix sp.]